MNKKEEAALASRVRVARRMRGLSVRALANAIDRSINTVKNWEAGDTPPSISDVYALAKALGVSRSWIVDGSGIGPVQQGAGL